MPRHVSLPILDQPPPTDAPPASDDQAAASSSTEHLDAIAVDELEQAAGPAPASDGLPLDASGLLSAEAFREGLKHALRLGGHLTGLQTLLASPEAPTFPDAAAATYESIRAVPALHFLIRPGGLWIQRAAAILVWAVPVGAGVRAELRARQAVPVRESSETAA